MNCRRTATALAVLPLAVLALVGCSSSVGGQAGPAPTAAASVPPSSTSAANPFAGLNPCKVLDQALAGQGYPPAQPTTADSKRSCATDKPTTGTDGIDVVLALQNGQTIDQNIADPSKAFGGDVNGRPAIQVREGIGAKGDCMVKMEVKPNSRALVIINLRTGTTDEACRVSNDVATKIEPLLPKSN